MPTGRQSISNRGVLAAQCSFDGVADLGRILHHLHPGRLKRLHFLGRSSLPATDDGAGMTHAVTRWGGNARDEADHRLEGLVGVMTTTEMPWL